ncbi:hypothetical protein ACR6A7_19735 [Pantoea sp. RRHST58]|uniref:hypothetical protein n=1 Tax=Pantoea sp. RRHST58 TaxID=3425183 RepID=UPI003DA02618
MPVLPGEIPRRTKKWLFMESPEVVHYSNILLGEALLALINEGKDLSRHSMIEKIKQLAGEAQSEAHEAAVSLAVKRLGSAQVR